MSQGRHVTGPGRPTSARRTRRGGPFTVAVALTAALLATAACSGAEGSGQVGDRVLDYRLWEKSQQTAYRACADAFERENPGLRVKVTQRDLEDYWPTLLTALEGGNGPDVFATDVARYPDLVQSGAILPLDGLVPQVDTQPVLPALAELWVGEDGKRYGMPKNWSATALFYNKEMLDRAGLSDEDMRRLTWNPRDGGSFERVIARLTVDANGVRGDQKGFDKGHVVVHGLGLDTQDTIGLVEWGFLAHTLGWTPTDRSPWGTRYRYDDPRFLSVLQWGRRLVEKGYVAPPAPAGGADPVNGFPTGRFAVVASSARMLETYRSYDGIRLGIAPTPVGPDGTRASMISSRADSISARTDDREDAAKWVAFVASARCQDIMGDAAVVLPLSTTGLSRATKAFAADGIDVSPFTQHLTGGTGFLVPVTDRPEEVAAILDPALTAVTAGDQPPSSLKAANDRVNALFD